MPRPYLGYHRISRIGDRPDTPVSEGQAAKLIRARAKAAGVKVEMLTVEKDVSGGRMDRPILAGALEAVEAGRAGGLIVAQYDRLSRATLADALRVIQRIEDAGGKVLSAREAFDTSTPEGRMGRDVFLSMAHMQLDRQKLYIRASKQRAVEQGIWPTNTPAIGYVVKRRKEGGDGKLRPDSKTRHLVVAGFEARAEGKSWRQVAGVMGVGLTTAQKIIRNRVYLGEIRLRHKDGEWVNPAAHEPLVTRELFDSAQLEHPRPPRGKHPPALLSGVVRCASCGNSMTSSTYMKRGRLERVYRCHGMPMADGERCKAPTSISQAKLDTYVEDLALREIAQLEAVAHERGFRLETLERELREAEAEWTAYRTTVKITEAGAETWRAGDGIRGERVAELQARLAEARLASGPVPDVRQVRELWPVLSIEERRHVLRGALGAVWVFRGSGACEERVRVAAAGFGPPGRGYRRRRRPLSWNADLPGELRPAPAEDVEQGA